MTEPPQVPDSDATDPVLDALWKRVLEAWDDDKVHSALLDHAIQAQVLPELAGRYRALVEDKEKGPLAAKKLNGIVVAATQMLMAMKTPKVEKTPWPITLSALGICALLLSWLAYALWGHRH